MEKHNPKEENKPRVTSELGSNGLFQTILVENWRHLRHVEDQRMWFTNVYAIIVAGSLTFISQGGEASQQMSVPILVFLAVLSVLGLLHTKKTNAEIGVLLSEIHAMSALQGYLRHVDFTSLKVGWNKTFSIRRIYMMFYISMIIAFVFLLFFPNVVFDC